MKRKLSVLLIFAIMILAACGNDSSSQSSEDETLTISAAASLTDVTKELEKAFNKEHSDVDLQFNYGGSGSLREQIEKGAPVDVLMSANTKDVDALKDADKVKETYDYAQNQLVLIQKKGNDYQSVEDLKADNKLAIGEVKSVPAGRYAQDYLKENQLWDQVENQTVYAKDVREVLNYVNKGNAKLGFVYNTDLYVGKDKHEGVEKISDAKLKDPIIYRMGVVSDKKAAKEWQDFMKSQTAKDILKEYHFEV